MLRILSTAITVLLLSGCATHKIAIDSEGRIKGEYAPKNALIQQIDFYEDGRVKSIQYWKIRPKTTGWSISF